MSITTRIKKLEKSNNPIDKKLLNISLNRMLIKSLSTEEKIESIKNIGTDSYHKPENKIDLSRVKITDRDRHIYKQSKDDALIELNKVLEVYL